MVKLPAALKTLLSDVVSLYFRAHGYHWNVVGQDFSQYHSLFSDIYSDIYGSVDPIAENLRKLDELAPYQLDFFIKNRTLDDSKTTQAPKAMATDLLDANEAVLKTLKQAFDAAIEADEQGIANFLAERIDMHQKWSWQLKASTK
jgi:starvation-inducible DNA-binding protein